MKTKALNRKQIEQQNSRTLTVGSRVQINFAKSYWANGRVGKVIEFLGEGRLVAVRVWDDEFAEGYTTIDCPLSQVLPVAW
ncbi:MAG: hypothetical protein EBR40_10460 [Proteobacteria bacterium]|nr:hypothetical protein [Pseudomonadota bacterium]